MKKGSADDTKGSETRRENLLAEKRKFPLVAVIILLLVVAGLLGWFIARSSPEAASAGIAGTKVTEKVDYRNQTIGMTTVAAVTGSRHLEIPLELIRDKKIVSFEYSKGGTRVPLMAFITPAGKLVTAIRMCEPCRSTKFHIEGEQMVCNACGTRWTLEGLRGLSGGCMNYAPDVVAHTIEGGNVKIDEQIILAWTPRV